MLLNNINDLLSTFIEPDVGFSKPQIKFTRVDLPEPLSPTIPKKSPLLMSIDKLLIAFFELFIYLKVISSSEILL